MAAIGIYGVQEIKKTLKKYGLTHKKRWGQNFIIDNNITNKIAKNAYTLLETHISEPEIWEIGPGLGSLSNSLYEYNNSSNLTLFEIDYGLIKLLEDKIYQANLSDKLCICSGDAEHIIISHAHTLLSEYNVKKTPNLICGNLPYSSSVRLLLSACRIPEIINEGYAKEGREAVYFKYIPMCVMLQKEVAERLIAMPNTKEYGVSTVLLRACYDISIDFFVESSCFYPSPNVESVICSFIPREDIAIFDADISKLFKKIVHYSFLQRRKKLSNTLGKYLTLIAVDDAIDLCETIGISMDDRAENIHPDKYAELAIQIISKK